MHAVYFAPALILVLFALTLAALDFFLARSEGWGRVRAVLRENNRLLIQMTYRVRATNTVSNLVYPFYLQEGTAR